MIFCCVSEDGVCKNIIMGFVQCYCIEGNPSVDPNVVVRDMPGNMHSLPPFSNSNFHFMSFNNCVVWLYLS